MFFKTLILAISTFLAVQAAPEARMSNGNAAETLRRFPHHVVIEDFYNNVDGNSTRKHVCAGSIVNQHWLITAASCVSPLSVLKISFHRLHLQQISGSFSVVVNSDAVHVYPTQYDNIALVRLPFTLDFSAILQPVNIYNGPNLAAEQFVVMPGFENCTTDEYYTNSATAVQSGRISEGGKLVYGMFSIVSQQSCEASVGETYDSFLQYCTKPWSNTRNNPNTHDIGSGLLEGWPAKPALVGIYTGNSENGVATYTNAAKYLAWINGVLRN